MSDEKNIERKVSSIEPSEIRPMLQAFNEDLGLYINEDQRYKLGRVLTIIDASIADPEQRKAIKDLVSGEWWSGTRNRDTNCRMTSPHTDLRGLCKALGFELYENIELTRPGVASDFEEYAASHYKKLANQQ